MTFTRFDLIKNGISEYDAIETIKSLARYTPCETISVMQSCLKQGVEVMQLCHITSVDLNKAIAICDKKLASVTPSTNVQRWKRLKKILNNMKDI